MLTNNTATPISHFRAWRAQKAFPHSAAIVMLVDLPRWTPGKTGWDFWQKVLCHKPATVGECIVLGKKFGYTAYECQRHLAWLYTWGGDQVEIGGLRYTHMVPVATAPAGTSVPTAPALAPALAPKAKAKAKVAVA